MTSLAAMVVAASTMLGQADEQTGQDYLKAFEPYIGTWIRERTANADLSDYGIKEGETYRDSYTYEWLFDGNAATIVRERINKDGKRTIRMTGLIYWDIGSDQIVISWVGRLGLGGTSTLKRQDDGTWIGTRKYTLRDGTRRASTLKSTFIGNDIQRVEVLTRDGQPVEDVEPIEWVRQK